MTEPLVLLDAKSKGTASFARAGAEVVHTSQEVSRRFRAASAGTRWVAPRQRIDFLARTLRDVPVPEADSRQALLVLDHSDRGPIGRWEFLTSYFARVVFAGTDRHFLPPDQMAAVMLSDRPSDYAIGGVVDHADGVLLLYRGSLAPLPVPFDTLPPSGLATPDFRRFHVTDHGQVLELGDYAASVEGILYERDQEFRRHAKAQRRTLDPSFGGAFRRLRIQRGLTQRDFSPELSEREVRRIETGETLPDGIQAAHRTTIARVLGVPFEQIASY